ncbi:MAG: alpha/beta hydrolase [Bdellovibrionota bacterium]
MIARILLYSLISFSCFSLTLKAMAFETVISEVKDFAEFGKTEQSVFIRAKKPTTRSVLVIHGLNLLPSKMNSVSEFYYNEGFNVLRLTLQGHDGNWEAYKKVTADIWIADVEKAFSFITSSVPGAAIDLFGYSLGAAAGIAAEQNGKLEFERMVLAAPPFEVTRVAALVEALFDFENLSIPSRLSPIYISGYGANPATPVKAYKALFELRKKIQQNVPQGFVNKPGIVFVSRKDEVVDAVNSVKFVESVSSFTTFYVEKKNSNLRPVMNHLIIDEPSLGETWPIMVEEIRRFNTVR